MPSKPPSRSDEELTADAAASHLASGLSLQIVGEGIFATHRLPTSGSVEIGRSEEAAIRIDDASISRRHAVVHIGSSLSVEDLGSRNGTRVGNRPVTPGERVPLDVGDVIDFGSVMAIVQRASAGVRLRRLWNHGYFEGRLEDECARAERSRGGFGVVRIDVDRSLPPSLVQAALAGRLRSSDMIAAYGPNEYELLLVETTPEMVTKITEEVIADLAAHGAKVRCGVACYPLDGRTPESLIAKACSDVRGPSEAQSAGPSLVIEDAAMIRLHKLVERIAPGSINVLLLGETGVGKEVMAHLMHERSSRADKPFLALNCAAFSETLLESELFGYERGAFTGANQVKPGLLETAQGGTVFLDEIGEMPITSQGKLLRVLEERSVLRLGALKPRSIDVRFVFATNRDLEAEIERKTFRQDLYFRINGVSLLIPPLRERVGEIERLARSFIARASQHTKRQPPRLSADALRLLRQYSWPGNIRELMNVIERAVLLCSDEITAEHLPVEKMGVMLSAQPASSPALHDEVDALERTRILDALASCAGNQTQAAKLLGISRGTLVARIEAYRLPRPRRAPSNPRR